MRQGKEEERELKGTKERKESEEINEREEAVKGIEK